MASYSCKYFIPEVEENRLISVFGLQFMQLICVLCLPKLQLTQSRFNNSWEQTIFYCPSTVHARLSKFEVTLRYLSADNMKMCPVKVSKEKKTCQAECQNIQSTEGKWKIYIRNNAFLFFLKMSTENEFRVQVHSWFPEHLETDIQRSIYCLLIGIASLLKM